MLEEFFKRANRGVFIDVGAARPDYLSISALYRAFGWRVIAIEPNPCAGADINPLAAELSTAKTTPIPRDETFAALMRIQEKAAAR